MKLPTKCTTYSFTAYLTADSLLSSFCFLGKIRIANFMNVVGHRFAMFFPKNAFTDFVYNYCMAQYAYTNFKVFWETGIQIINMDVK